MHATAHTPDRQDHEMPTCGGALTRVALSATLRCSRRRSTPTSLPTTASHGTVVTHSNIYSLEQAGPARGV